MALGTSIAATFNAALLLWFLSPRLGGIEARRLFEALVKITIAAGVMGVAAYWTSVQTRQVFDDGGTMSQIIRVFSPMSVAFLTLAGMATLLRVEEFNQAMRRLFRRFTP